MHAPVSHPMVPRRQGCLGWGGTVWAVTVTAAVGLALVTSHSAHAKTFRCPAGDVACLIAAITEANAAPDEDTIRLSAGAYTVTAVDNVTFGPNGLPSVTTPI